MPYYAIIGGPALGLILERGGTLLTQAEHPPGSQLLDFLYCEPETLRRHLAETAAQVNAPAEPDFAELSFPLLTPSGDGYVLHQSPAKRPGPQVQETEIPVAEPEEEGLLRLFHENVYLHGVCLALYDTLLDGAWQTPSGFQAFCGRYGEAVRALRAAGETPDRTLPSLLRIFEFFALGLRALFKRQLEFCLDPDGAALFARLTPAQRLFQYEQWRMDRGETAHYFNRDLYPVRLLADESVPRQVYEVAVLDDIQTVARYELVKMVMAEAQARRCTHCGRFFIPEGRSDAEYCPRPLKNRGGKTCQDIGAAIKYRKKTTHDPIHREYQRAYKRHHARIGSGRMTKEAFQAWRSQAQARRDRCLAGELPREEFFEWLGLDRVYRR